MDRKKTTFLVVEWNGQQNKNDFNEFEQKAKNYNENHPIFLVHVYHKMLLKNVLVWEYKIFDADTKQLVSEGEWTLRQSLSGKVSAFSAFFSFSFCTFYMVGMGV